ncbi:MAG: hypothetical protein EOO53_21250 [Gammaproteobacteria bacterium]|nr:MAG: hypothetical protein EOO53_21250 [Gammaproteobacteria bacterium]
MRQLKSVLAVFIALAILGVSFTTVPYTPKKTTSASLLQGNAHVNGGGTALEGGVKSTFVFNAVQLPDGSVNGHLHYNIRLTNTEFDMDITCLSINGNRATLYGTVTSVSGSNIPSYIFVGNTASFTVEDNGNGKAADKISDVFLSTVFGTVSCADNWNTYLTVSGNISIKE